MASKLQVKKREVGAARTAVKPDKKQTKKTASRAVPKRTYLPANERRQSIISAAQEVFSRVSLQGARTRELAKAAAVNQATLFEHFESKEELFHAAVVQPLLEVMQGMRERAQSYGDAASLKEMLALGQASSQRHLEAMVQVYPLLATALFSDPALGKKLYCEQIVPLLKERGKAMRKVVKEGVDPELLSLVAFGMYFAIAMDRTFRGKKDDLAAITKQLTNLVTYGFVTNSAKQTSRK